MSYEAIANARKLGAQGIFQSRWITVPTRDIAAAIKAFQDAGYETAGGVKVLDQGVASALAEKL